MFTIPKYLETDLLFNSRNLIFNNFNSIYLMFLGGICLFYPIPKIDIKSKLGVLLILIIIYYGTYIIFLLTWTPVGELYNIWGVQPRYFLPMFGLLPFTFGLNHLKENKSEIDEYIVTIAISFMAMLILSLVCSIY